MDLEVTIIRGNEMEGVRKMSRKYYVRQIAALFLASCLFFNTSFVLAAPAPLDSALPYGHTEPYGGVGAFTPGVDRLDITGVENGAVIRWENFDIGADATVQFQQVSDSAWVLNRVSAADSMATGIMGELLANGGLIVVNPRGIVFGDGAFVDARSFIASGLNIDELAFRNFADGTITDLQFQGYLTGGYGGNLGVLNNGTIGTGSAGDFAPTGMIYLIGKTVTNKGSIITSAGGCVVMAAGENVYLSDAATSNVTVQVAMTDPTDPGEHVVDNGGTQGIGSGTVSSAGGKIILAAGDIFSTAITGIESLRAEAKRDIAMNGAVQASGDVTLEADRNITLAESVQGGALALKADADNSGGTDGGTMWAKSTLTSTTGNIEISASDNTIDLDDDVTADVDLLLNNNTVAADEIVLEAGRNVKIGPLKSLTAEGDLAIVAGGAIDAESSDIIMAADGSTLKLTQNPTLDIEADFRSINNRIHTNLDATSNGATVTSDEAAKWNSIKAWADDSITLSDTGGDITTKALTAGGNIDVTADNYGRHIATDDITAGVDVSLYADDGVVVSAGKTIHAGQDVKIGYDKGTSSYNSDVTLTGLGALTVEAGRDITLGGATETAGALTLDADGDVTTLGNLNAGGSIDIYSSDNTTHLGGDLVKATGDITLHNNTDLNGGNQRIDAVTGTLIAMKNVDKSTSGDMTLAGGTGIELAGNVTGSGLTSSDTVIFEDDVTANRSSGQRLDAGNGTLWAKETITKTTAGDLTLGGSEGIDLDYTGGWCVSSLIDGLIIEDDFTAAGDLGALSYIKVGSCSGTTGTWANGEFDGVGNQQMYADGGAILVNSSEVINGDAAEPYLHKTTDGDLTIDAGSDITMRANVTVDDGALTVLAGGTAGLYGNLKSTDDMTLSSSGRLRLHGNAESTGGSVAMTGGGDGIWMYWESWGRNVKAYGDILLNSDTHVLYTAASGENQLEAGGDVYLKNGKDLASSNFASLHVRAGDDILLGAYNQLDPGAGGSAGNVSAGRDLVLDAGDDIYAYGNIEAGSMNLTAGNKIDAAQALTTTDPETGNIVTRSGYFTNVYGEVTSVGNLDMTSETDDIELYDNINVTENATLNAGGHIELATGSHDKSTIGENFTATAVYDIEIYGDVEAGGDIVLSSWAYDSIWLYNDYIEAYGSITLDGETHAAGDIIAGDDVTANSNLELFGGECYGYEDQFVVAENGTLTVDGWVWKTTPGDLYLYGNNAGTDAISLNNNRYSECPLLGCLPAASTCEGNLEIYAPAGDIQISGDLTTFGWCSEIDDGPRMVASGDGPGDGECCLDWWYDRPTGGVSVIADNGKIYTDGAGEEGEYMLNIGIVGNSDHYKCLGVDLPYDDGKAAIVVMSSEDLKLGPDSMLIARGNYYDAGGLDIWDFIDFTGVESYGQYFDIFDDLFDELGGCIADHEAFCSAVWDFVGGLDEAEFDFGDLEGFKELFTDFVDGYFEDLLTLDDRPAVGFLDVPATVIGGIPRDEGDPIDVAVYLASTQGNVELDGRAIDVEDGGTMVVDAYDTVSFGDFDTFNLDNFDFTVCEDCIDAGCVFGKLILRFACTIMEDFEGLTLEDVELMAEEFVVANGYESLDDYIGNLMSDPEAHKSVLSDFLEEFFGEGYFFNIDRLEVSSRITEWLYQAVNNGTLPYAADPAVVEDFIGGDYILRGAGLGNLGITDGRAWVLENPVPPAPLYTETGQEPEEQEFAPGGCPVLMAWLANEIGVPAEEIQVYVANTFAFSTDIQPCEVCSTLKDAATILADADGTSIAALAGVVNEYITPGAPIAPEQMTLIAAAVTNAEAGTVYAAAGQWLDAMALYVGLLNSELGYSAADSVAFAGKYTAPVTTGGNAALAGYVEARLAELGL